MVPLLLSHPWWLSLAADVGFADLLTLDCTPKDADLEIPTQQLSWHMVVGPVIDNAD